MVPIRLGLVVVRVAGQAGELGVVARRIVALGAAAPLPPMAPAVDGEPPGIVVEGRRLPGAGGVASLTGGGERRRGVAGIGGVVEVRLVAVHAEVRQATEDIADMALRARGGLVHARERIRREVVVEPGVPRRGPVARGAVGAEPDL